MSADSVSVVIAAHNAAGTLSTAIGSVLSQSCPPLEVIIVDDGSTDDTVAVTEGFGGSVRVISQPQAGPSAARNAGIAAARGRWIAFLDADDRWHPSKLALQLASARRHPKTVLIASDWTRAVPVQSLPMLIDEHTITEHDLLVLNRFQTSTVLLDRDVAMQVGGFDPKLDGAEDWDLWLRTANAGIVAKLECPLVQYVDRPDGYSKDLGRVYDAMLLMLQREFEGRHPSPSNRAIYAWHLLRWAVAFRLAGEAERTRRCLSDLRRLGLVSAVPCASIRYLVPFLLGRVTRRLRRTGSTMRFRAGSASGRRKVTVNPAGQSGEDIDMM